MLFVSFGFRKAGDQLPVFCPMLQRQHKLKSLIHGLGLAQYFLPVHHLRRVGSGSVNAGVQLLVFKLKICNASLNFVTFSARARQIAFGVSLNWGSAGVSGVLVRQVFFKRATPDRSSSPSWLFVQCFVSAPLPFLSGAWQ